MNDLNILGNNKKRKIEILFVINLNRRNLDDIFPYLFMILIEFLLFETNVFVFVNVLYKIQKPRKVHHYHYDILYRRLIIKQKGICIAFFSSVRKYRSKQRKE